MGPDSSPTISVQPRNLWPINIAFFLLLLIVPPLPADLVLQALFDSARPLWAGKLARPDGALGNLLFLGSAWTLVYALLLGVFPQSFLADRVPLALRAFRIAAWGMVAIVVFNAAVSAALLLTGVLGFRQFPLAVWVAWLGLPLAWILWRGLRQMRWLKPESPPASWEKMIGIDGPGENAVHRRGGVATPPVLAMLLPPLALLRARYYTWAGISSLLMIGVLYFLIVDPLRALVPLAAAFAIGRRVSRIVNPPVHEPLALNEAQRYDRIMSALTPGMLDIPPAFAVGGLLGFACLCPLLLVAAWFANWLGGADSADVILTIPQAAFILLFFAPILVVMPAVFLMPMGIRFGIRWYQISAALALALYVLLLCYFCHLSSAIFGPLPPDAAPMARIAAWVLAGLAPISLVIAASIPGAGRLPNVVDAKPARNRDAPKFPT